MLSLTKSKSFWFQQFYIFTLSSYTYFPFISWFTIVENLFGGSKSLWSKHFASGCSENTHFLIADYFEQDVILIILSHSSFWVTFHFEQLFILIILSKKSFWSFWANFGFGNCEQIFICQVVAQSPMLQ